MLIQKKGKGGYDEYENVCIFRAKYCWKGVSLVAKINTQINVWNNLFLKNIIQINSI